MYGGGFMSRKSKSKSKSKSTFNLCNIKNFIYPTGEGDIDITPLFVFMAGSLYRNNALEFKSNLYRMNCIQKKLSKEVIQKYIHEYIQHNCQQFNRQESPTIVLKNDKWLNTLYDNVLCTFQKTIHIADSLVFLNVNYDFSDKILDFINFSFLLELYKEYIRDNNDIELIRHINAFVARHSLLAYDDNAKSAIIVQEGGRFLEYIFQILKFLTTPQPNRGLLEEQAFFKQMMREFPDIIKYLYVNFGLEELKNHANDLYDNKDFSVSFKEKADKYYPEGSYIPLLAISELGRRYLWCTFQQFLKESWYDAQIQYHFQHKDSEIQTLKDQSESLSRENKNLTRACNKHLAQIDELVAKLDACEGSKQQSIDKIKNEANINQEELEELRAENFVLKDKLAKHANRIKTLEERTEIQYQILNRIPDLDNYIANEEELDATIEEELNPVLNQNDKPSIEEMKEKVKEKRLFFIHGIQGYDKNLNNIFDKYSHICINDKQANFVVPQEIDGIVILVKTTPHAHVDRATKMKPDNVPIIPSTNKNIDLVIEDIYNFYQQGR